MNTVSRHHSLRQVRVRCVRAARHAQDGPHRTHPREAPQGAHRVAGGRRGQEGAPGGDLRGRAQGDQQVYGHVRLLQ